MQFSKFNNPSKRKATIRRKQNYYSLKTCVIVYVKTSGEMIEKKYFKNYETAENYVNTYKDSDKLGAFILF